jgi:LmbE family N-acetylglucosaminyl deacetylase
VASLGTILGVWAHPDDETYLSAGLMAKAVRNGQRVVCVTATRGEEGSQDHIRWPPAEIGMVREKELDEALAIIGVQEHHWLDYHDGACDQVDPEEAVAKVVAIMEEVQPDTVLTFDPKGHTLHPDHMAVHRWTTRAFARAAKPGASLYYTTQTPEWIDEFVPMLAPYNVFGEATPMITPKEECGIYEYLDDELIGTKLDAVRVQVSQTEGLLKAFGDSFFSRGLREEAYMLGATKEA